MPDWLRKISKLPPNSVPLALAVFFMLIFFKLLLVLLPFKWVNWIAKRLYRLPSIGNPPAVQQLRWLVDGIGSVLPLGLTCLPRALTFKWFTRADTSYSLIVGVQMHPERGFEAHAWIDHLGRIVLGDQPDFQFTPIWRIP